MLSANLRVTYSILKVGHQALLLRILILIGDVIKLILVVFLIYHQGLLSMIMVQTLNKIQLPMEETFTVALVQCPLQTPIS